MVLVGEQSKEYAIMSLYIFSSLVVDRSHVLVR